ncbi:hypothetical protein MHH81_21055 [Psychrobacillus sp. FSL H8-0484]|uniref:hypothetical protein n=1 Tax=Psychrobacillus sp. FSL H8-0484 TaxID=2921390 RepID=UPI0030F9EA45
MKMLTFLAITAFVALLILLIFGKKLTKKHRNESEIEMGSTYSPTFQMKYNELLQKLYIQFSKVPVLKGLLARIRLRLETLSVYDEYTLRREVMRIIFVLGSVITLVITASLLFRPSWQVTFWIALGVLFLCGVLIDYFVTRVETRLLIQLKDFNNRVRFYFQSTKMVDEAIYEAMQHAGNEMKIQANRIYSILTSVDPEKELAKYEEVAPSRFLKVVAGLELLVKDKGDMVNEKGSAFLRGLTSVNELLNEQINYRSKLTYQLRGLSVLSLAPIFFALPIKNWAVNTFPIMLQFYDSRLGFIAEIVAYGISVIAYLMIRKMGEVNEEKYQSTVKKVYWEQMIIDKVPLAKPIVHAFTPEPYTKAHFKLSQLLKDANSPLKIEWFTVRRILTTVGMVLLIVGLLGYSHVRVAKTVLASSVPDTLFAGAVSEQDRQALEETNKFDRRVISDIQTMENVTSEDVQLYIADQLGISDANTAQVKTATDRILNKWAVVENAYLKWWEVLIAIAVGLLIWNISTLTLRYKAYMRKKDMENEIHQHLVLISILREFDHMSVYIILTWMERFSFVFKEPIQEAIHNYDAGPEEALIQLGNRISFEPFQQIVERLKLSVVRISIKDSFDDIDLEKEFYFQQRAEANNRSITEKGNLANIIGLAPIFVLTGLYLICPLFYISIKESQSVIALF